jgi:PAS domain S-box-containing protein
MRWAGFLFKHIRSSILSKGLGGQEPDGLGPFPQRLNLDAQNLLDMLPAYVTVHDKSFCIRQANASFRRDFGDGIGLPCFKVYKGRDAICPECALERTLAEGRRCTWEEALRTIHQETINTVAHTAPIYDAQRRIVGALKISSDVNELKRLQRQLELSQREYKALFSGVPCYISIQDRDFRIIKTNRLFEKDFGRALGRRCFSVYKGRDEPCPDCPVEMTFRDGEIHSSEEVVQLNTGEEAHMLVYTAPLYDLSGQIFAVMEMATNISEVKRLQRELSTVGEAVAVTAHAIKNILNGLKGGAYVVQSGLKRQDPALAQQGWEMVSDGVDMVSQLVKDILLISKERVPEYQKADPNDLAKQVWTLFEKRMRDLGIQFNLQLDRRAEMIYVDPKGVHTVLSNLISNAMDACLSNMEGEDHQVLIRVRDLGSEGVSYEVEDNGIGVPVAIRDRLFWEVISTKGNRGTGLGLLATKKIVEEHGGRIALDSKTQRGTLIRVRFPRTSPQQRRRGVSHSSEEMPAAGNQGH